MSLTSSQNIGAHGAGSAKPRLLVAISGNLPEWQDAFQRFPDRPRLPLPYTFGAACHAAGFDLCAVDLADRAYDVGNTAPLLRVFRAKELAKAVRSSDLALLSGSHGVRWIMRQAMMSPKGGRRAAMFTYTWDTAGPLPAARRARLAMARLAARWARGVVVMTREQAEAARRQLPRSRPVINMRVGVDHAFYALPSSVSDVGEAYRDIVECLLDGPYAILPGGQQRLNRETLDIFAGCSLRLVRIAQSGARSGVRELEAEAERRGMADRIVVLEKIDYRFLRFLFQNAAAYAGIVDSSWQPAGWTAACESLASGTPVVVFEGLVSRELARLKPSREIVTAVPMGDTDAFRRALQRSACSAQRCEAARMARAFAQANLDLEETGRAFARQLATAFDMRERTFGGA